MTHQDIERWIIKKPEEILKDIRRAIRIVNKNFKSTREYIEFQEELERVIERKSQ
jgi:hypothetical protein